MDILAALRQEEVKLQRQLKGIQGAILALNGSHPTPVSSKLVSPSWTKRVVVRSETSLDSRAELESRPMTYEIKRLAKILTVCAGIVVVSIQHRDPRHCVADYIGKIAFLCTTCVQNKGFWKDVLAAKQRRINVEWVT